MEDDKWNELNMMKIVQTENGYIVFMIFYTIDDVTKLTSKAKNLPKSKGENDPCFVMYVDPHAKKNFMMLYKM